jgi:PAS domain S-box-containing protein
MLETAAVEPPRDLFDVSFFRKFFDDSPVPTLILGADGTALFWNDAAEGLFGWSAEEVLGHKLPTIPPDRIEEYQQLHRRALAGEGFSQRHVTRLSKDGRRIELSLSTWPIRSADGHVTATVGIYTEILTAEARLQRTLAKEQLEELERLYATAPIGLGFLDTELRFVRVNERLAQIDGLAAEAHIGRRLADVVPEVAESLEGIYREAIETGTSLAERELRAATPALPGVPRDWLVSAYPLKHPDGSVLGVTFAVSDITERKRWSDELKLQEALLRLLIDSLPGLVFYVDRDWRYRFASRSAGEWFKRSPSDFEGHHVAEVLGEDLFGRLREPLQRAFDGEEVVFEGNSRYPDRERDIRASYVPDRGPGGAVRGIVALVQDVTEQKRAERALRESEERFRRMVEIAGEGIWFLDSAGRTTFLNDRMADLLGYRKEEMLGRLSVDFLDAADRDWAWPWCVTCNDSPRPQEHRFRHKDGKTVWLDITLTSMEDDRGASTGVLAMCTDVTERKLNEQRLRQAQKLESLGILAGGVAHDFNNLLTGILGNTSLALVATDAGSSSRRRLEDVIAAGERAAQLTRQRLTYAGKDQGQLEPLDIAATTRELVPLLTASIPRMVHLSLDLEDGTPLVQADPVQLQQVMMNLVINAAESIPDRTPGEVKIAVRRRRLQPEDYRDAVFPFETEDREYVLFSVTDNGAGMDAATQARIFDPFFSTKFQGRGLGLSAVLGIVKRHGGMLTLRSAPESGTVFTVLLPASQVIRETAPPARTTAEIPATVGGTVLFVDDEPALRTLGEQTLEQHGYKVLLAENGREAISVLAAHPEVGAIVLDLTMPVMSGETAAPIIRSLRPDVPLILSSGYSASNALERVGGDVVTAFLEKPYQASALVSKLEELMRSSAGSSRR